MAALRTALRALLLAFCVVALGWVASVFAIVRFAARDNARAADAIVVLGAAQYAGRPSPVLRARLDHALALWNRNIAPRLIVTGGVAPGDMTSEAAVAQGYAERMGVPGDSILLEPRGRTTSESMQAVAEIMESNGMQKAVLVSDPFHMFRLWLLAKRYGFDAYTSPTPAGGPGASSERRWGYILRESVKAPAALFLDPSW